MKLLLDLGNSRCKYAVVEKNIVKKYGTQNYGPFGKLYGVKSLCDQYSEVAGDASGLVICSVLSEVMNAEIKETLTKDGVKNIYFLTATKNTFGVKLAYSDLSSLGIDRVASLIAANEKYTGDSCIVDCGTAITIDAIDAQGVHQGGVIIPGAEIMKKAVLANTKIEVDNTEVEFNVLSKNTENAIYTGCVSAAIGGIEYVVNKMAADYDGFGQIILTGGGAELVTTYASGAFRSQVQIDDTLVLDGLNVVSQNI